MIANDNIRTLFILIIIIVIFLCFYFVIKNNMFDFFTNQPVDLQGKSIFITAATSGLGLVLAENLAKYPCKLFITGKDRSKVEETVLELQKINKNVHGESANFENEEEITKMWNSAVKLLKRVDYVINVPINTYSIFKLHKTELPQFKEAMNRNVESVVKLNNLAIGHMKWYKIKGRIINVSNLRAKYKSTKFASGTDILSKNTLETYSSILANEVYGYDIAVVTIRLDKDVTGSRFNYKLPIKPTKLGEQIIKKFQAIPEWINGSPKDVLPVFIHCLKAPFHEVAGKMISTNEYFSNKGTSNIVSPGTSVKNNDAMIYFSNTDLEGKEDHTILYKQNPFKPSSKITDYFNSSEFKLGGMNVPTKYKGKLLELLSHKNKISKDNIVLFRTENDALIKILDIFVPKNQEIISENPYWQNLVLYSKDKNIHVTYIDLKIIEKKTEVSIDDLLSYVNERTKLIYLSSPNIASGQTISKGMFEAFLEKVPDNIILLIDQRFFELSRNKETLNALDYIENHNIVVLRSFSNFYGIESLTISYLMCNAKLSKIIHSKTHIYEIDKLSEKLAVMSLQDNEYKKYVLDKMEKEYNKVISKLDTNNIEYCPSETYYFLINTTRQKADIMADFDKESMVLYNSSDNVGKFWSLPLSKPKINNKITNIIINYNI